MATERDVVKYIILSIVTCGIWGLVWVYQVGTDIAMLRGDDKPSVVVDLVLSFVSCGLWGFVCAYRWPEYLNEELARRGRTVDTNLPAMSLLMAFFGLHVVGLVLMQESLNKVARDGGGHEPARGRL